MVYWFLFIGTMEMRMFGILILSGEVVNPVCKSSEK